MKKIEKKIILGSAAALLAIGGAVPAFAEDVVTTDNTIDTTKTGSITLYKLKSEDGKTKEGTALEQDLAGVGQEGIEGVKFNYVKVGELKQIDTSSARDGVKAGVYYTLTDAFKTKMAECGVTLTADVTLNSIEYFTAETVNAALKNANLDEASYGADEDGSETANEKLISFAKDSGAAMDATDEDGKTSANGLDLGLYLVAEVESPNLSGDGESLSVAKVARPFLVSLPMTNIATITTGDKVYEAGSVWQYDVTAYPKNEMISIRKDIVADGNDEEDGEPVDANGLVQTTNKCVGEYINFLLTLDAPKLISETNDTDDVNGYRKYVITDTMSKGLTVDSLGSDNFTVTYGNKAWNGENNKLYGPDQANLNQSGNPDYTIELLDRDADSGEQQFVITLTETGLAKLSTAGTDSKVFVNYKARLNADAVAEDTGAIKVEANKTSLVFGTKTSRDYEFKSNEDIKVYTYEVDIAKSFSHEVADMSAVGFTITRLNPETLAEENLVFIEEEAGVYHIYDNKEEAADSDKVVKEVHCAANGKLILKGLDADTYVLTEESTVKGYNLMRDTMTIEFDDNYLHDGVIESASLASGVTDPIAISNEDLDNGVVSFGIKNNETIEALHTGGDGWSNTLLALGGTAILAGGALFIFRKRKEATE